MIRLEEGLLPDGAMGSEADLGGLGPQDQGTIFDNVDNFVFVFPRSFLLCFVPVHCFSCSLFCLSASLGKKFPLTFEINWWFLNSFSSFSL